MTFQNRYADFLSHYQRLSALRQVGGILSWDQETMMPPKGATARAVQMGSLEHVLHGLETDPAYSDLVDELADHGEGDAQQQRSVALAKRSLDRTRKVPADLAAELAKQTALGQGVWAQARANASYADFASTLEIIVKLKREEADAICSGHGGHAAPLSRYDALLNDFEPGMTSAVLGPLLEGMRPRLSKLRAKVADSGVKAKELEGPFDTQKQMTLSRRVADALHYDFEAGRLDLSVHPFSSGTGGDARITTRVDEADPLGCLYSTIHEIGHALYEQGLPENWSMQPLGHHVSMGVHESQSRLWENQVGRSLSFCRWLQPQAQTVFGSFGAPTAQALYATVNRVETGFIRTEADEVHYNLHVLLRFELERKLIEGEIDVADLEAEWNATFERDFGLVVPDAAQGVLQDVHWSCGLFGYFPTYALGNIYAAQLFAALKRDVPELDAQLAGGNCTAVLDWLRSRVHQKGRLLEATDLMQEACEAAVSSEPLLDYLEDKFGTLYDL
ncbi:MAG: carboxypeptidase M32 [Pseudomonadota bacterium]